MFPSTARLQNKHLDSIIKHDLQIAKKSYDFGLFSQNVKGADHFPLFGEYIVPTDIPTQGISTKYSVSNGVISNMKVPERRHDKPVQNTHLYGFTIDPTREHYLGNNDKLNLRGMSANMYGIPDLPDTKLESASVNALHINTRTGKFDETVSAKEFQQANARGEMSSDLGEAEILILEELRKKRENKEKQTKEDNEKMGAKNKSNNSQKMGYDKKPPPVIGKVFPQKGWERQNDDEKDFRKQSTKKLREEERQEEERRKVEEEKRKEEKKEAFKVKGRKWKEEQEEVKEEEQRQSSERVKMGDEEKSQKKKEQSQKDNEKSKKEYEKIQEEYEKSQKGHKDYEKAHTEYQNSKKEHEEKVKEYERLDDEDENERRVFTGIFQNFYNIKDDLVDGTVSDEEFDEKIDEFCLQMKEVPEEMMDALITMLYDKAKGNKILTTFVELIDLKLYRELVSTKSAKEGYEFGNFYDEKEMEMTDNTIRENVKKVKKIGKTHGMTSPILEKRLANLRPLGQPDDFEIDELHENEPETEAVNPLKRNKPLVYTGSQTEYNELEKEVKNYDGSDTQRERLQTLFKNGGVSLGNNKIVSSVQSHFSKIIKPK